jgi:orotate phosphoribosyltransferase
MLEKVTTLTTDWKEVFVKKGALWVRDQNPKRPHAITTTGRHSGHYFDSRAIVKNDKVLAKASKDILKLFEGRGGNIHTVDCVVGPATGGTKFAKYLSYAIANMRGYDCMWASPAKREDGDDKCFVFDDCKHIPQKGQTILMCDDTLSTGSSFDMVSESLRAHDVTILDTICVLLNRYGNSEIRGRNVVSLVDYYMPTFDPLSCALCKAGSTALRPRKQDNWKLLTAQY